jgi:hypothetical protein
MNAFTGVATAVGPVIVPTPVGDTMDLAFDRLTGFLRLISSSGQNLLLNPTTGTLISVDSALAFKAGDANAAFAAQVVGTDFSVSGAAQTLYAIDTTRDVLATISTPSSGQLTTIGPLSGFNPASQCALHIPAGASYGWASLSLQGANSTGLYVVNLSTGSTISLGAIRTAEMVRDIVVAPPHDVWKQSRFSLNAGDAAVAGPAADPNGNGVANLLEYALGGQRGAAPSSFLPVVTTSGDHLTLAFTRPVSADDVICKVQVSDDLVNWQEGSVYSPYGDTPSNSVTTEHSRLTNAGWETITVRDNTPISGSQRRFLRLMVTEP